MYVSASLQDGYYTWQLFLKLRFVIIRKRVVHFFFFILALFLYSSLLNYTRSQYGALIMKYIFIETTHVIVTS